MCGINGIIDFNNTIHKKELVALMNQRLHHRGPDDEGIWENENSSITFGHTRLSILDVSAAGHQPMIDPETSNVIVFNGEIFNCKTLQETHLKGEKFNSSTDTEIILKLYQKFGINMLTMLDGMFAFAIYNYTEGTVLLARDFSGKKPLYFTEEGNKFSFSSEIKALLTLPFVPRKMDEKAFYDFLTFNTVSTPKTMFIGIKKFESGHYMLLNKSGISAYAPFKSLKKIKLDFNSENELADLVFSSFSKSVKDRLLADVPIGVFLSGGVDSSAILALMKQNTESKINTFTVGFEDQDDYNENHYAEKMASLFQSDHHLKIVKKEDLLNFLPRITEIYDEPQADTTAIPIYFISQLAREKNIKVILNGDGADELFAGYRSFLKYSIFQPYFNKFEKFPHFTKNLTNFSVQKFSNNDVLKEFTERLSKRQEFFWTGAGGLKESQKRILLSKEFNQISKEFDSHRYIQQLRSGYNTFSENSIDFVNWMCYSSYMHADREQFLFRSDRLGMANSVETRSPFLSFDMVQLALNIPGNFKIKNNIPKYILKKSFEQILPKEILYRKKMGFCLPLKEWAGDTILNELSTEIAEFCNETNFFNLAEINVLISDFKKGNNFNLNRIWTIYYFMKWYKKWM